MNGFTSDVASNIFSLKYDQLPVDVVELAKQCVLDLTGVAIAGASESLVDILVQDAIDQGSNPVCKLFGRRELVSTYQAALINGAISHALDYDDVNMSLVGHPSAAIIPSLLALAESRKSTGKQFIESFVTGYEAACAIGDHLGVDHYQKGFHCTGTIGSFGATGACAHMLGLNQGEIQTAIGIASTQASGMKLMFGTMCKPMHAGLANQRGLMSAMLAKRGFTSRMNSIEAVGGFAKLQCDLINQIQRFDKKNTFYINSNLFKYHAACYNTHAAIEAIKSIIDAQAILSSDIEKVFVRLDSSLDSVCNIQNPLTGLEAKFSVSHCTALAIDQRDTSKLMSFDDSNTTDPSLVSLRNKIQVQLISCSTTFTEVEIITKNGQLFTAQHDSGIPNQDIFNQRKRLENKFYGLVEPILGQTKTKSLMSVIMNLDSISSINELTHLITP
jgi:2-methylcitrate dehydratase PrpD